MLLENYSSSRDNNFNLIRLIAAYLVLVSHSYAIVFGGGQHEPLRSFGISLGGGAVDIFFVTSGFLITKSFLRSNIFSYAVKRVLRIFPALIVAVFLMVLLFSEDYYSYETLKFIVKNTTLIMGVAHTLPGAFVDTPLGGAVNGSLWTLPWEIWCYIAVVIVSQLRPKILFPSIAVSLAIASMYFDSEYARICAFFFVGGTIYLYQHKIILVREVAFLLVVVTTISIQYLPLFKFLYFFTLPYLVFYLAYVPKGRIREFNKIGDYSYGLYIYAFPVQQVLTYITKDVFIHIAIASIVTFVFAFLSWHLIEKQFLRMKFFVQIRSS